MQVIPIPCSFDNYSYLLICEKTGDAAVVDPGEAYPVLSWIEKNKVRLTLALCTHHHQDHVGAVGDMVEEFPGIEVVCHSFDRDRIGGANCFVEDGDIVQVGKTNGQVLFTPGHTRGHICYQFGDTLFTGDTLFGAGCGRLFEGTALQMYSALNEKIAALPQGTRLFFGHEYTVENLQFALSVEPGNADVRQRLENLEGKKQISTPSTLALEKLTNPFLRCDAEEIRHNLRHRGVENVHQAVQVFTELRKLRDLF